MTRFAPPLGGILGEALTPATEDVALSAALISVKRKLPMADSLIFATAQAHGAVLWTQDDDFEGLPGVNYRDARTKVSRRRARPRASA